MVKSRLVHKGAATEAELERLDPVLRAEVLKLDAERKSRMSPEGELGLPALLEKRRLEYGITDGAFAVQPYNDTVLVYQISRMQGETFGDSSIIMPDVVKKKEHEGTPQGIVVAAGLQALDSLRMNGMDLGHVVAFCRVAPWRIETDKIGGRYDEILVFRVGDVVGSVDLADSLRDGTMEVRFDQEKYEHYYHDPETGVDWHPQRDTAYVPNRS